MARGVVVLSAVRSAIGGFGGSLSSMEPSESAGTVMKEAVTRSGVDPKQINYVTVGNCIPTESRFLTYYRDWETDRKSTRLNSSH